MLYVAVPLLVCLFLGIPQGALAGQASLGPAIAQQTQQVVNESSQAGEQKREEFLRYLQSQLDELDLRIEKLKVQSDDLREKARAELLERLDRIKAQKEQLLPKLEKATRTSEAAWEDIKDGLDRAATDLRVALEQAASHFF